MAYQTRNWTAVQTTDPVGSEYNLKVTGEVQVLKSNEEPHLSEAKPQGIVQTEIILDLTVTGGGEVGGNIVVWKTVTFERRISADEFHSVMVRQDGSSETIQVQRAFS